MEHSELKLTAVWMGSSPPPSTLPLSAYTLPLSGPAPEPYLYALYGNRNAYLALGELLTHAQQQGLYVSTATVSVELNSQRKVGVMHMGDLEAGHDHEFINLSRVSKEVIANVAALYKPLYAQTPVEQPAKAFALADGEDAFEGSAPTGSANEDMDWRRPFRFMPAHLEQLPDVFGLLQCTVLVHPVRFVCTPENKFHYIASIPKACAQIVSAVPNSHEVGVHPSRILIDA